MTFDGLDLLGAELPAPRHMSWTRGILAFGAGVLGAALYPKHWALMFLNAAALTSNVHAVTTGDRTTKDAIKRMGRHVVATAGSLALPKFPVVGYVAGAIAADLLIDGEEHNGIIDEWMDYEGIRTSPKKGVIDAEFTENKPTQLVKTS